MKKVLALNNSNVFFELLKDFRTLKLFFKELADLAGVSHSEDYPQMRFLLQLAQNLRTMNIDDLKQKYSGKKLGDMLREKRISLIRNFKNTFNK